ncbi:MAG: hypothetical protein JKY68_02770 [Rhodospirillales bacterium]|nr:hypothetical protein [Rhodospirillales bacterium]
MITDAMNSQPAALITNPFDRNCSCFRQQSAKPPDGARIPVQKQALWAISDFFESRETSQSGPARSLNVRA